MEGRAKIGARRDSFMRAGGRRFSCESTPVGALSTPIFSPVLCINCELVFNLRRANEVGT